jgi:hypothetical protein
MSQNPQKGFPQLRSISISRVSTGLSEWPRNWRIGVLSELDGKALEMWSRLYRTIDLLKKLWNARARQKQSPLLPVMSGSPGGNYESRDARKEVRAMLQNLV